MRSWISWTSSPLRDGYHTDDHEGSISGKYCFSDSADPGRGCSPVPGTTGEYHSAIPCSTYIGIPSATDAGCEVCRQR